jgi:hypothetical protein
VNRRSFISGLIRVGAFAAFDPHRVIFDMGRGLFLPQIFYDNDVFDGLSAKAFAITQTEGLDRIEMARGPIHPAHARALADLRFGVRYIQHGEINWSNLKRSDYPLKLKP